MLTDHLLLDVVRRAIQEDLAGGDLTTESCVDPDRRASAEARARSKLVVCGGAVFRAVFAYLDPEIRFEARLPDGVVAERGAVVWTLEGKARSLLMGERTALNLVQRMSGTATLARRFVDALPPGSSTRIVDTRKTTPGLRALERYAVRTGGAHNHRNDLGSAILIKDNHLIAAGGVEEALRRARARAPHTSRIELEVDSLQQLEQALAVGVDIVLLDNFSTADVRTAVDRMSGVSPRPIVEVSGGITLDRIRELADAGADVISVGALTHSAPAADIALDFVLT